MSTLSVLTDSPVESTDSYPLSKTTAPLSTDDGSYDSSASNSGSNSGERTKFRSDKRTEFPYDLRLTQIDTPEGTTSLSITVKGRDCSEVGIGFYHNEPLPFRRGRLEAADEQLDALGLGGMSLEITICWCRFIEEGRYEFGSRVTSVKPPK